MNYKFHPEALIEFEAAADFYAERQKGLPGRHTSCWRASPPKAQLHASEKLFMLWIRIYVAAPKIIGWEPVPLYAFTADKEARAANVPSSHR